MHSRDCLLGFVVASVDNELLFANAKRIDKYNGEEGKNGEKKEKIEIEERLFAKFGINVERRDTRGYRLYFWSIFIFIKSIL